MPRQGFTASYGVVDRDGARRLVKHPYYEIDDSGLLTHVADRIPEGASRPELLVDLGPTLVIPGLVNAHSHAFQRGIRGMTQRRGDADPTSFWSWRTAMYGAAMSLDPEGVYRATLAAYREMVRVGITCVGEFHYLHHDPEGRPYDDPNELSHQVVRAAEAAGIRVSLLEVYYARSGPGGAPHPEQRRFCDGSVEAYLARVDALRSRYASHPLVDVGLAPHSVRAVPLEALREIGAYAARHELPVHAHVSEQTLENEACLEEHGVTPTRLLAQAGLLEREGSFTSVHGIHVDAEDIALMRRHSVCACPSTEADLGDGILPALEYCEQGTNLALGTDSNAVIDLVQEGRLLEMHERLRRRARLVLHDASGGVASRLVDAATLGGARSLGRPLGRLAMGSPFDAACIDLRHPFLADVPDLHVLDALWMSGTSAPIDGTYVAGRRVDRRPGGR